MPSRYEQGKHLTLVSNEFLSSLTNLRGDVIPTAAAWLEATDEMALLSEMGKFEGEELELITRARHSIQSYMVNCFQLFKSVNSKGLDTMSLVLRASEEAEHHRDAGQFAGEEKRGGLRNG